MTLEDGAIELLLTHPWPGNVRELENCIKRVLALTQSGEPLSGRILEPLLHGTAAEALPSGPVLRAQLAEAERRELETALEESHGNKSHAAELLGVSRKTLYARMRRLGIEVG